MIDRAPIYVVKPAQMGALFFPTEPSSVDDPADFVERLARVPAPQWTTNPYTTADPEAVVRRRNLLLYLRQMRERRLAWLLVGEAPGYRGCRRTGVPFTSETILLADPCPHGIFGPVAGFGRAGDGETLRREATATIVWQTLGELGVAPLLWNAFPFHPYHPGRQHANRRPTSGELAQGETFLRELMRLFPIRRVVAVGTCAGRALKSWGIPAALVRHPSHGGKTAFRSGLARLFDSDRL